MQTKVNRDGRTLTVRVPLTFRRRGGRKLVLTPAGSQQWAPPRARIDSALVKALARAHRWKKMMENGQYGSVTELAAAEKINQSYVCRVLRLTLLAPDIVDAMLSGTFKAATSLERLLRPFPTDWRRQRCSLAASHEAEARRTADRYGPGRSRLFGDGSTR
jgi:hypothetical protein